MQWDILRVVCVFVVFLFSYICFDVCICTLKGLYTDALHLDRCWKIQVEVTVGFLHSYCF